MIAVLELFTCNGYSSIILINDIHLIPVKALIDYHYKKKLEFLSFKCFFSSLQHMCFRGKSVSYHKNPGTNSEVTLIPSMAKLTESA